MTGGMMFKGTPGDWHTNPSSMTGAVHAGKKLNDEFIASVYPNAPDGWNGRDEYEQLEEMRANARLISAAPNLLRACLQVAHFYEDGPSFANDVKSAIAKALGEQK